MLKTVRITVQDLNKALKPSAAYKLTLHSKWYVIKAK